MTEQVRSVSDNSGIGLNHKEFKMRPLIAIVLLVSGIVAVAMVSAQPPGGPGGERRQRNDGAAASASVARMMTLDTNKDGKLSKDEVSDSRLAALFERADADHDGILTKEELIADFSKEAASSGGRGPGGPGGFPGGGPGGPGGPGMGGPPPLGQVLPTRAQDELQLSKSQREKIDALQKHVDEQLAKILTDDQKKQFEEMRSRGPRGPGGPGGGFGPPGGPGGDRGRNGGPPGEGGRPRRPSDE